jgi:hypothetical protein
VVNDYRGASLISTPRIQFAATGEDDLPRSPTKHAPGTTLASDGPWLVLVPSSLSGPKAGPLLALVLHIRPTPPLVKSLGDVYIHLR